jgi:hypothetical protein
MRTPNLIAQANFGSGLNPDGGIATEGIAAFNTAEPLTGLEIWISQIISLVTTIGSITFVFIFLLGAFKWISAGDDSGKLQKARDQMVQAVIGLVIMVAGYAIIGLVGEMIGIKILQPAQQIEEIFNL